MIEELNGERPQLEFREWRPGGQRYCVSDTTKLKAAVGWSPIIKDAAGVDGRP